MLIILLSVALKCVFVVFPACSCSNVGTVGNYGCDKITGLCRCKRFVTGRNCDECYVSVLILGIGIFVGTSRVLLCDEFQTH